MFDNIGRKIKGLAATICWLGIIASLAVGISLISLEEEITTAIGIVIIILGALSSWIGSFLTYGFGQLVENSDKMVASQNGNTETVQSPDQNKLKTLNRWLAEGLITKEEYDTKVGEL